MFGPRRRNVFFDGLSTSELSYPTFAVPHATERQVEFTSSRSLPTNGRIIPNLVHEAPLSGTLRLHISKLECQMSLSLLLHPSFVLP